MAAKAFIVGVGSTALSAAERDFLREAGPWGLCLFARNVQTPEQLHALVDSFRSAVGRADFG